LITFISSIAISLRHFRRLIAALPRRRHCHAYAPPIATLFRDAMPLRRHYAIAADTLLPP